MSPLIDDDGRIGGRVNIVDALVAMFFLGLIPVAYSSWLLFHPAQPRIDSVEHSEITSAELRIAAGLPIRQKVKIRGGNLTPVLRAYIDDIPAMGFTFETPASGDVIIGENVPYGTHDLVLYDGPVEVARARGAVTVAPPAGATRAVVRVRLDSDPAVIDKIRDGDREIRWTALDDRAAAVERVERGNSIDLLLRAGLDRSPDGWRYHGQPVLPGEPFTLVTDHYALRGTVVEVTIDGR